jgi:hypothetical protein
VRLLALGAVLGLAVAAGPAYADEEPSDEILLAAAEAHVDPWELLGAVNTTRLPPRIYLIKVGDLPPPSLRDYAYSTYPDAAWCIERIVGVESGFDRYGNPTWFTGGRNPRAVGRWSEHASGLGGFLPSTWASTPQAHQSIWNGEAQIDAIDWMLVAGRGTEFAAVSWGRCHGLYGRY